MKVPERVADFHDRVFAVASHIVGKGEQSDPMFFMEGDFEPLVLNVWELFEDSFPKAMAAEILAEMVDTFKADFAAYLIEAWIGVVTQEEIVQGVRGEDLPGAREIVIIQAELREGGFWFWEHLIAVDDTGTRILDPEAEPQGPGDFHRFILFPRKGSPCPN